MCIHSLRGVSFLEVLNAKLCFVLRGRESVGIGKLPQPSLLFLLCCIFLRVNVKSFIGEKRFDNELQTACSKFVTLPSVALFYGVWWNI